MIGLAVQFALKHRKWLAYGLLAVIVAWGMLAYRHSLIAHGRALEHALWVADTAARDAAAAKSIQDARNKESAARAANQGIVDEYSQKLVAIAGERDGYFGLLQRARGQIRSCGASAATGATIAIAASEASIGERIDRAVAATITEHLSNSAQLDALIAVVKQQL